ncbi:MAG: outer membrane beta-barrel protein [Bacteroidota bacterium]
MKNLLKITLSIFVFLTLAATAHAQDGKKQADHKHHWHFGDSTRMKTMKCAMEKFNMDEFPLCRDKKKFNGHWAGIDLGIGGYVTPGSDMNFSHSDPFLNLNTARSVTVNINPFELNLNLWKNHIGFTTGLGFQVTNYNFSGNYVMIKDSSALTAYQVQDAQGKPVNLRVNKLVTAHLNLPLFFEYQTNPYRYMNSFHVTLGVVAGVRIGSYTKQVYKENGGSYILADQDGNPVYSYDVDHYSIRDVGSFHLNPFKLDAAFRIGWSHLNIFGTYSVTRMFQKNQGPEVYPFTVGLTLLGW